MATQEQLQARREAYRKREEWYKARDEQHKAELTVIRQRREWEAQCVKDGATMPGEIAPTMNYSTVAEARQVAANWLKALHLAVLENEPLIETERRIYVEWVRVGCPALNMLTGELLAEYFFQTDPPEFDSVWTPLPEAVPNTQGVNND
jgi:hypothetical protein